MCWLLAKTLLRLVTGLERYQHTRVHTQAHPHPHMYLLSPQLNSLFLPHSPPLPLVTPGFYNSILQSQAPRHRATDIMPTGSVTPCCLAPLLWVSLCARTGIVYAPSERRSGCTSLKPQHPPSSPPPHRFTSVPHGSH